jgi:hypothetical protein
MKAIWMFSMLAGIGLTMGCGGSAPTSTAAPDPKIESAEYEKEMESVTEPAPE